jgi:hypothetical protein
MCPAVLPPNEIKTILPTVESTAPILFSGLIAEANFSNPSCIEALDN